MELFYFDSPAEADVARGSPNTANVFEEHKNFALIGNLLTTSKHSGCLFIYLFIIRGFTSILDPIYFNYIIEEALYNMKEETFS